MQQPGRMAARRAPHCSGVGEVVACEARNADAAFALQDCLQEALNSVRELIITRTLYRNVEITWNDAKGGEYHPMDNGRFRGGTIGTRHSRTPGKRSFEVILFILLNHTAVKAPVQDSLQLCIHMRLHRPPKEIRQLRTFSIGQPVAQRLELAAIFFSNKCLA